MVIVVAIMLVFIAMAMKPYCIEASSNSATGKIVMAALECTIAVKN